MANQRNFKTRVSQLAAQYTRFSVSRIVETPADDLIEMEVPADFPNELLNTNIELAVYTIPDSSLVYLTKIKNYIQNIITTKRLQYSDSSFRTLLFIDFSKLEDFNEFPVGQFSITLSFFVDEFGSEEDKLLKLRTISPSRREVEAELIPKTPANITKLANLATPGITLNYIDIFLRQVFNISGSEDLYIPASDARMTTERILANLPNGSTERLETYGFIEDSSDGKPGIDSINSTILNKAYDLTKQAVNAQILSGNTKFTATQLKTYVVNSIDAAYDLVVDDAKQNPNKYRFNLI